MKTILDRKSFLKEALWKGVIDRSKNNIDRKEDILGQHKFTDRNGVTHEHGILANPENDLCETVAKVIYYYVKKGENVVDLNLIDMSEITSIDWLFKNTIEELEETYNMLKRDIFKLKMDASGWDMSSLTDVDYGFCGLWTKIGAEKWNVSEDCNVKLHDFMTSPYMSEPPAWCKFRMSDWIAMTTEYSSDAEWGEDDERSEKLGKPCYWVILQNHFDLQYLPDFITIREINGKKCTGDLIGDVTELKSIRRLPKVFKDDHRVILRICLKNIEDEYVDLPANIHELIPDFRDNDIDIKKLPRKLDCGITFKDESQICGYIQEVVGNVDVIDLPLSSLHKLPDIIHGRLLLKDITSLHNLRGFPVKVNNLIINNVTNLDSFDGCCRELSGDLILKKLPNILNLLDLPKKVKGDVEIEDLFIHELYDFPETEGNVILTNMKGIDSFEGFPEHLYNNLHIQHCNIKSIKGFPKQVDGQIYFYDTKLNGHPITIDDILEVSPELNKANIDIQ
jgi:hypothetical protein